MYIYIYLYSLGRTTTKLSDCVYPHKDLQTKDAVFALESYEAELSAKVRRF